MRRLLVRYAILACSALTLTNCARIDELGSRFYKKGGSALVKGTITGLSGQNLTLSVNGQNQIVSGSPVEYTAPIKDGETYTLAIGQQPLGPQQLCTFSSETTGVVNNGVLPFALQCSTGTHTVSGSVTGLAGTGLQLQLNGGEIIPVSTSAFTFANKITDGQAFNVQVKVQPSTPVQICTPEYNVGIVAGANVTTVSILCSTVPYSVGGYVNGLATGQSVTLQVNGGQSTVRSSDGFFLFPTPLADQTHFDVTVISQPTGQTCSVQSSSGAINGRGSYATYVQCSSAAWTVSGIVSGLSGGYVTLVTSAGEYKPVVANGAFSFSQKFASGSTFAVEVFRNPASPAQTCTVMNGTGTNITTDVGSVSVTCSSTGFTIGGGLTGLTASGLVLRLNGTSDVIVPVGSSSYTFADSVATGGTYSVAIASQPTGLKCTVTPATASGTVATANVTNAAVTCQTGYTVGGTVTGLNGNNFVLRNTINGGTSSDFVISTNSFTFPELMVAGDTYSVQILNHPESPYQTCGASNSGGTIAAANITNVSVSCTNVTVQFQAVTSNAAEANATIDIPITISPASARPLNLTLALAAGTAASGVDFNFLTPTINVPIGATTVNAQVQVFQDSTYEPNETVIINLTGVDKAALGAQVNHTHTINNDDGVTATKVVTTNSGSNFTAGGNTTITVQVQDTSSNLATTDNATQITFTPTGQGRINSVTTGAGDGGYGVAGGAETITVAGGVATVVIANTVAQSFQIAVTNNAALTNPANIALTSNAGAATQVVITSAAPDTTAGGPSSLTVQVQDANGNLVTGATTQITFSPTLGGTITGVTTGSGDGSYGVAAGAETISVSGGIATITLTNNTAQTYQVAITNNGGLANPANDSVTISPAAASQVVLTGTGSNFITGGTTNLTVQIQDSFGNVRASDSATQVTFSPTNSGRITAVGVGTGDGGYGVAGGAETVTVASGVATVTIGDAVSETFQIAFTNSGGLTNPADRSLTASNSATQVAITQAGADFIVGNSTTLTVQVQTSGGTLVTGDNTTQITFTPTNSGRVTGVTTGTGDGSYGVAGGAEVVTVAGGVATITLSDSVAETFQVAMTNNAALSNPANDSITVTNASGAVITKAEYFDINHNGKIDRVKITFDKNVDETTISGDITTQFLIAGYSGVALVSAACIDESYPTNGNCTDAGELTDTTTNNIIWLSFTEGPTYDTGATPDLTGVDVSLRTTAGLGACYIHTTGGNCSTQSAADFGTSAVAEADKAPPVFVATWADPIIDAWQLKLQFSEAVDLSSGVAACSGTVTNAAFTYNNVSSSNTSALRTDFADSDGCDSTSGNYYVIPRVNARFAHGDLKTDTLALASTFYDSLGQGTISTTKTIGYDPNLELYYPMDAAAPVNDDNSTVHDVTANNRHGTVSGAVRVRDMGENNYSAYKFDGVDDKITATGYTGVTGRTSRTISAWVWSDYGYFQSGGRKRGMVVFWGSGTFGGRFGLALNNDSSEGQVGGVNFYTADNYKNGNTPTITGQWTHVAITWADDGTPSVADGLIYVNGRLETGTTTSGTNINTNAGGSLKLGEGLSALDHLFRGKMDEVRVYSRALSAAEIKKLAVKVPGGLVAQYPFDDNSGASGGISDSSGNGLTLTNGSATWTTDRYGVANAAMSFSGQSITGTTTGLPLGTAARTVCAWARTTALPSALTGKAMMSYGVNATNQEYTLSLTGGALGENRVGLLTYSAGASSNTYRTDYTTPLNTWQYFCATSADANNTRLYINGLYATTLTTGSPSLNTQSGNFVIGNNVAGSSPWSGAIDDIRIYNRALTAGEVKALATEVDRGLVAYFPLDDNVTSGTVADYSGNANNMTIVGTPTITSDHNNAPNSAYALAGNGPYFTKTTPTNIPSGSASRTACLWANAGAVNTDMFLFSMEQSGNCNANQCFRLKTDTGFIPSLQYNGHTTAGPITLPLSQWFHICATYDGTNTGLYLNGQLESSTTGYTASTVPDILRLANNFGSGAKSWNGSVDDFRVYNRVLSVAEIRELSGFYPAHAANLAVWYDASRIGDTGNPNPADGSTFDNWLDLSLTGGAATKGNPSSTKPTWRANVINGLPTIRFLAANSQRLENSSFGRNLNTTAHTQLSVFRADGGGAITAQKGGGGLHYRYNTGPVMQSEIGGSASNANTAYVDNTFMIGGLTYSNPNGTFYRNGVSDGTFSKTAASNTNVWAFGGNDSGTNPNLNGDIAEIVIYDRVLTAAELEKVNCYYNKKYAIAVSGLVCE